MPCKKTGGSPPLFLLKEPELRALRPRADGVVVQVEAQLLQTGYLAQAAGEVLAACVASGRRERHANFRGKKNSRTTKHSGGFSDAPGLKMVILGGLRGLLWMKKLDNPKAQDRTSSSEPIASQSRCAQAQFRDLSPCGA